MKVNFTPRAARKIIDVVRQVSGDVPVKGGDKQANYGRTMPQMLFAVRVTKDGGSAGTVSASCTFTYTCTLDSGFELGTLKSPQKCRLPNTPYTQPADGSWGAGFYDKDGTFVLWDANECPQVEDPCPEASTELVIDGGDAVTGGGPS